MPATITRSCPNGHLELTYTGTHELDGDVEFVRETAIPESAPEECPLCESILVEEVES